MVPQPACSCSLSLPGSGGSKKAWRRCSVHAYQHLHLRNAIPDRLLAQMRVANRTDGLLASTPSNPALCTESLSAAHVRCAEDMDNRVYRCNKRLPCQPMTCDDAPASLKHACRAS